MPRVLIVDDDADARRMYATALRATCQVDEAEDGRAAMRKLETETYALLVLDLHMPHVDGFEVLAHLGERDGKNSDVPVLIATADGTNEAQSRVLKSRSAYFLSKPIPIRVFIQTVQSMLERSAARAAGRPR
jgi:DNA-binding response OmpR family regulator